VLCQLRNYIDFAVCWYVMRAPVESSWMVPFGLVHFPSECVPLPIRRARTKLVFRGENPSAHPIIPYDTALWIIPAAAPLQ
jgi:hypothetical protein